MKTSLYFLFFFLALHGLGAQQRLPLPKAPSQLPAAHHFHPCGSNEGRSEWLKQYQRDPAAFAQPKSSNITYLPMTLHIVGTSDSSNAGPLEVILASFCQLNRDFESTGIQFFIEPPIRYLYNSAYYSHDSVVAGGYMMLQHNVPNTINVYFVASPAGNCGYNLPYAGVAMNYSCLDGHTFAHELGHNLGLPHTFLGWEGGVSWDGSISPNFNQPAPQRVTYNYTNFKDTMWLDTLIIDTALVEYVDRSGTNANCNQAADGFCDTEADYLAYRWFCNGAGESSVQQLDPAGTAFRSKGRYIMSYANDACQSVFTPEQTAAMQAFIANRRQNMLYNQNPRRDTIDMQNFNPISPVAGTLAPSTYLEFRWNAIPGAQYYFLEIYREPYAFNQIMERVILSDTFYNSPLNFPPRNALIPYGWRVLPYNYGYTCAPFSNTINFNTYTRPVGLEQKAAVPVLRLYPNPVLRGQSCVVDLQAEMEMQVEYQLFNSTGQSLWQGQVQLETGTQHLSLPTDQLSAGLYWLMVKTPWGLVQEKLVVQP